MQWTIRSDRRLYMRLNGKFQKVPAVKDGEHLGPMRRSNIVRQGVIKFFDDDGRESPELSIADYKQVKVGLQIPVQTADCSIDGFAAAWNDLLQRNADATTTSSEADDFSGQSLSDPLSQTQALRVFNSSSGVTGPSQDTGFGDLATAGENTPVASVSQTGSSDASTAGWQSEPRNRFLPMTPIQNPTNIHCRSLSVGSRMKQPRSSISGPQKAVGFSASDDIYQFSTASEMPESSLKIRDTPHSQPSKLRKIAPPGSSGRILSDVVSNVGMLGTDHRTEKGIIKSTELTYPGSPMTSTASNDYGANLDSTLGPESPTGGFIRYDERTPAYVLSLVRQCRKMMVEFFSLCADECDGNDVDWDKADPAKYDVPRVCQLMAKHPNIMNRNPDMVKWGASLPEPAYNCLNDKMEMEVSFRQSRNDDPGPVLQVLGSFRLCKMARSHPDIIIEVLDEEFVLPDGSFNPKEISNTGIGRTTVIQKTCGLKLSIATILKELKKDHNLDISWKSLRALYPTVTNEKCIPRMSMDDRTPLRQQLVLPELKCRAMQIAQMHIGSQVRPPPVIDISAAKKFFTVELNSTVNTLMLSKIMGVCRMSSLLVFNAMNEDALPRLEGVDSFLQAFLAGSTVPRRKPPVSACFVFKSRRWISHVSFLISRYPNSHNYSEIIVVGGTEGSQTLYVFTVWRETPSSSVPSLGGTLNCSPGNTVVPLPVYSQIISRMTPARGLSTPVIMFDDHTRFGILDLLNQDEASSFIVSIHQGS